MTVDFQDHFWGDKQNGFDVLYQNLKSGSASSKELTDFLRSRSFLEEQNVNFLVKLSRKTNNSQHFGTFQPLWQILKTSTEKLSSLHMQTLQRLNQLIKEINKYCEDHHKKQKQIKNEELSTIEAINELKETISSLNKAKEFYYAKTIEVDRLRRENASQKDIEKAETRVNKACSEYKNLIDKYKKIKEDFEKKFCLSCQNFQKLEQDHLKQMKDYLHNYSQIFESGHALIGQVYKEFQNNCNEMTIEKLLETFTKTKGTGTTRLADIHFEEANLNSCQLGLPSQSVSNTTSSALDLINLDNIGQKNTSTLPHNNNGGDFGPGFDSTNNFPVPAAVNTSRKEGFLRSTKDKSNKKLKNKKDSEDEESNNGSISGSKMDINEGIASGGNKETFVDAEGYTIRPSQVEKEDDDFYSSSDSESNSEDEKEKKIYVKINPLKNGTQISASVDQLIASAGALSLAPSSQSSRRSNLSANPSPVLDESAIKRSVSATQTAYKSNENDLFEIFNKPNTKSSINLKTEIKPNFPSSDFDPLVKSTQNEDNKESKSKDSGSSTSDRYAPLSELLLSAWSPNETKVPLSNNSSTLSPAETTNSTIPAPKTNTETSSFNTLSLSNSSLSKSISSTSIMANNSFPVYKSLSKSFANSFSQSMSSNGMMSRADSVSSLSSDFRMTPISICSSRDSSPLTIGMSDTVPIAIAFQESIGACFKGTDENLCKINVIGCIKIAFSSGIIQVFSTNPHLPRLTFRLKNINRLERVILSKELINQIDSNDEYTTYEMNMSLLQSSVKRLYEQTPNARYYNLDIIKYQLRTMPGAKNAPLQLVSYWKCEPNATNLKIDFKYNSGAFINSSPQPLRNVQITANVDGNVLSLHSQPEGKWDSLTKQAVWKFNEINQTTGNSGLGHIKAKFDLSNGPSLPSSVYVQFMSQDTSLSGLDFELIGSGYRLSLIKRQFSSGRYYCEPKV